MKSIYALLVAALLLVPARADQVSDLVAQMPPKDPPAETALAAKLMASGGEKAVTQVCAMLVPLGTAGKDDTAARYAVTALMRHAGRPGGEADRAAFVRGVSQVLAAPGNPEVRTFLVNRLQEVGRDDAVPTLAPLLTDEQLAPHAAAALERIASPAAIEALGKALPNSTSGTRVAIIKSLGMLRSAASVDEIAKSLEAGDEPLKLTAAWALANLGSDRANDVLASEAKQTSAYRRSKALAWMLLEAQRQAEAGRTEESVRTCKTVLGLVGNTGGEVNVAGAVLHVLVRAQGTGALPELMEAAASDHPQYRNAALDAAMNADAAPTSLRWAERLKTFSPAAKVDLLNFLARRNHDAVIPAVLEATKDQDAAVRRAALATLVSLNREQAIPALVERVTADTPEVAKEAAAMLSRIPGERPLSAAAGALASAPAPAKVMLLELLAARGAKGQKDAVLAQTADANAAVRLAALRAMEKLASEADAPRLVELTVAAKDSSEESAALRAAVSAASQAQDAEKRGEPFLSALNGATGAKRGALERGLARVGGKRALDVVLADLKSGDATVRDGATRALAEWQDPAAIAPLLEVARSEADASLQVTALRGAVAVIKASTLPEAEKAAAYAQAMAAAKRPEERKAILGALGNEKGQAFFDLAAQSLDQTDVQAEAALAVIKTALPPARGQAGLKGPKVLETLKRAIEHCPAPALKDDAGRYVRTLERGTGQ